MGDLKTYFCVRLSCIACGVDKLSMSHSACQSAIRQYHAILILKLPSLTDILSIMLLAKSFRHAVELALDAV
jgi:hypothetical protein